MITKERLEELIEQGATIYDLSSQFEPFEIDFLKVKIHGFFNDGINFYIECPTAYNGHQLIFCEYKDLYEFKNKEDAEEYAEFGNITRTERLELNNYETFLKSNTGTMFYLNACEHLLHKVRHKADDENPDWRIEVCVFYNDLEESSEILYSKPLTRENYNEARRLCVKLFKGEE